MDRRYGADQTSQRGKVIVRAYKEKPRDRGYDQDQVILPVPMYTAVKQAEDITILTSFKGMEEMVRETVGTNLMMEM